MLTEPMPSPVLAAAAARLNAVFPPEWGLRRVLLALLNPATLPAKVRLGWYEHDLAQLPLDDPMRYAHDPLKPVLVHVIDGRDDRLPTTEQLLAAELDAVDGRFRTEHGPIVARWTRAVQAAYVEERDGVLARYNPRRPS